MQIVTSHLLKRKTALQPTDEAIRAQPLSSIFFLIILEIKYTYSHKVKQNHNLLNYLIGNMRDKIELKRL